MSVGIPLSLHIILPDSAHPGKYIYFGPLKFEKKHNMCKRDGHTFEWLSWELVEPLKEQK